MKILFKTPKKILNKIALILSNLPMPGHFRWRIVKYGGVRFIDIPKNKSERFIFIGENVVFDSAYPEDIEICNHVHITTNCIFLTHYLDTKQKGINWLHGKIKISKGVFIGANSIITKPLTIGEGSIIGAGSVVTKDIPPYQIWAGNPARYIKDVERK